MVSKDTGPSTAHAVTHQVVPGACVRLAYHKRDAERGRASAERRLAWLRRGRRLAFHGTSYVKNGGPSLPPDTWSIGRAEAVMALAGDRVTVSATLV